MEKITTIKVKEGQIITDLSHLPDGSYILYALKEEENKDISYYQRLYGALKDTLYKEGETGYTPKEIHNLAKYDIFPKLDEEDFTNIDFDYSTKFLTLRGWQHFIEKFKIFAQEYFNCYI
jgi:hypothetical protein